MHLILIEPAPGGRFAARRGITTLAAASTAGMAAVLAARALMEEGHEETDGFSARYATGSIALKGRLDRVAALAPAGEVVHV